MLHLFRILAHLPLAVLHPLGALVGWLVYWCSPTWRQRFVEHAEDAGCRPAVIRSAVAHSGRMLAELPRLWLGPALACRVQNQACVLRALEYKRGVIFLTPHLGCFELAVQEAARRWVQHFGGPITVLYRPARQPWLAQVMRTARNRYGVKAVPTTTAGVRHMIKALRAGRAVGLLPDQVPPMGQGVWVPFFGRNAYTMTLAVRLAWQTGATVIVARCERLSRARGHEMHLEEVALPPASKRPENLKNAVALINEIMEDCVKRCPQQYLWGYDRYRQPRVTAQEEAEGGAASGEKTASAGSKGRVSSGRSWSPSSQATGI